MKNYIVNYIRSKLGYDELKVEIENLKHTINEQDKIISRKLKNLDELTRKDCDLGFRGNNTMILTGVYRGKGYVQFYDMPNDEFKMAVDQYRTMRKHNLIRHIDAPYNFTGSFDIH